MFGLQYPFGLLRGYQILHVPVVALYANCIVFDKIIIFFSLHKKTDISPFLTSISPVLSGQIEELLLSDVSISSRGVGILVHSMTSPHCRLHKLLISGCIISSSDYCHLTTAIATSNMTYFHPSSLSINVAAGKALARALTQSKTLEEVHVLDYSMNSEVARALVEAMNHSSVKILRIGYHCKEAVSECFFPTNRVKVLS